MKRRKFLSAILGAVASVAILRAGMISDLFVEAPRDYYFADYFTDPPAWFTCDWKTVSWETSLSFTSLEDQ
jgi:hypothetical protein